MIAIPKALENYFASNTIAAAANELAKPKVTIPAEVEWSKLDDFYVACGAAVHIKVEYARFLNRLWEAVWGNIIIDKIVARPAQTAILVEDCWVQESYLRKVVRTSGDPWLWLGVDLDRHQIGVSLSVDGQPSSAILDSLGRAAGWRKHDREWVILDRSDPLALQEHLPILPRAAADALTVVQPLEAQPLRRR